GVGLADKGIPLCLQHGLQGPVVLNDAIVYDADVRGGVGVAVDVAGLPVGGPAGVPDAAVGGGQAGGCRFFQPGPQGGEPPLALDDPDADPHRQGQPRRVVAPVFQFGQSVQQYVLGAAGAHIAYNATHKQTPLQPAARAGCQLPGAAQGRPVFLYVHGLLLKGSVTVLLPLFALLCRLVKPSAGKTSAEWFDDPSPRHPHGCHPRGPALFVTQRSASPLAMSADRFCALLSAQHLMQAGLPQQLVGPQQVGQGAVQQQERRVPDRPCDRRQDQGRQRSEERRVGKERRTEG